MNWSAMSRVWLSAVASVSTSQLPGAVSHPACGPASTVIGLSIHSASNIFCANGSGTARRSTRRR
ncbi:hypothetical protein LAUMK13_01597 [Mycobacterium innocens]|uniref:Uncharacterized protein n=1 Tax=Mycobacterium innocens TaxID=2341083 RepID=A0A498PYN3_9MYCO|nr:hypothetical protein LAUMK13_01597 [Mycobacterium innocens]